MLMAFTYLPGFVTTVFRGMPTVWRGRHRLIFCWLIFIQALHPGRHTLEEMARWTPATITAWRFGRLLKAAYWNAHLLVSWLAQDLVATLPAPANGIPYLCGDGSHADKRGMKNPVAQKGRISQHHPWFFGLRFALLMAAWDGYRLPVGFRLILPKCHRKRSQGYHGAQPSLKWGGKPTVPTSRWERQAPAHTPPATCPPGRATPISYGLRVM